MSKSEERHPAKNETKKETPKDTLETITNRYIKNYITETAIYLISSYTGYNIDFNNNRATKDETQKENEANSRAINNKTKRTEASSTTSKSTSGDAQPHSSVKGVWWYIATEPFSKVKKINLIIYLFIIGFVLVDCLLLKLLLRL